MIEDTIKEFFEILDQQEEKKYPDENGNDVYWNPTRFDHTNKEMDVCLSQLRNDSSNVKQTLKDFFRIMDENEEIKIGSCRVLDVEKLRKILPEMKDYIGM